MQKRGCSLTERGGRWEGSENFRLARAQGKAVEHEAKSVSHVGHEAKSVSHVGHEAKSVS